MVSSNFTLDLVQDAFVDTQSGAKIKTFRREQSKFFVEFSDWMKKSNVGVVTAFAQSESNGWITLTMCYYERREPDVVPPTGPADIMMNCLLLIDKIADKLKREEKVDAQHPG